MKNQFSISLSSALVVGVASANAGFAAESVVKIDTKNKSSQETLEKNDDLFDDVYNELTVNKFLNKNQKIKEFDKGSKTISNSASKKQKIEESNENKQGFFSKFANLTSLKASFAGMLAFVGFSAASTALTAETVGLTKISRKLGVEKNTANYITVGTGVAAAVLATAEFLIKGWLQKLFFNLKLIT